MEIMQFQFCGDDNMMKKCKRICKIAFGIPIAAILIFMISIPIVNDNIADKTAERIQQIELPDNTQYLETFSKAGKLSGNGNGMQYIGGMLIKSDLSLQDLQSYYSRYAENEWDCIVAKQTDQNISCIEHGTVSLNSDINGDTCYVVYSWGDNDSLYSELDLRGH